MKQTHISFVPKFIRQVLVMSINLKFCHLVWMDMRAPPAGGPTLRAVDKDANVGALISWPNSVWIFLEL